MDLGQSLPRKRLCRIVGKSFLVIRLCLFQMSCRFVKLRTLHQQIFAGIRIQIFCDNGKSPVIKDLFPRHYLLQIIFLEFIDSIVHLLLWHRRIAHLPFIGIQNYTFYIVFLCLLQQLFQFLETLQIQINLRHHFIGFHIFRKIVQTGSAVLDHPGSVPLSLRSFQFIGICRIYLIIINQSLRDIRTALIFFHFHIDLCLLDQHPDVFRSPGLCFFRLSYGFCELFRLDITVGAITLHPDHVRLPDTVSVFFFFLRIRIPEQLFLQTFFPFGRHCNRLLILRSFRIQFGQQSQIFLFSVCGNFSLQCRRRTDSQIIPAVLQIAPAQFQSQTGISRVRILLFHFLFQFRIDLLQGLPEQIVSTYGEHLFRTFFCLFVFFLFIIPFGQA